MPWALAACRRFRFETVAGCVLKVLSGNDQSQVLWYLGRPSQIEKDFMVSEMY